MISLKDFYFLLLWISLGCSLKLEMKIAPYKEPRPQNAPGNIFVDESCIDCDVCRWMCPSTYSRKGVKSIVYCQPSSDVKLQFIWISLLD